MSCKAQFHSTNIQMEDGENFPVSEFILSMDHIDIVFFKPNMSLD